MECCLLCLKTDTNKLNRIKVNSTRCQEFDMVATIEKHFWLLNTIQPSAWICLTCWREVEDFHKFYMRIQEAHKGYIEPEIQIYQIQPQDLQNTQILNPDLMDNKKSFQIHIGNGIDSDKMPLKESCKHFKLQNCLSITDPLEKSKKYHTNKSEKRKHSEKKTVTEEKQTLDNVEIKKEPIDLNDPVNFHYNNNDKNRAKVNYPNTKLPDNVSDNEDNSNKLGKTNTNRKESDQFIAENFKQMFCDCCEVPLKNFADMKKHFALTHSNPNGYLVCCGRKFHRRNHLVDHIHCHFNSDYFKCTQCGKLLSDRKSIKIHMLRIHQQNDGALKHSCDICGKSFPMAYILRAHKLTHLTIGEKKFSCRHCGKFYASSHQLKMHTEVVHLNKQAKVCHICGKTLRTNTEYKSHIDKHNGISRSNGIAVNCDVCGLRLNSERILKLHKESQHPVGGKKDHPCSMCDRISPTATALKKHIFRMHEKGYDYKCAMCEKVFRRPEGLKEHVASQHTGTVLYTCIWCPKTFNSNGNMHTHRKKNHPKEWIKTKLQKYSGNLHPDK